MRATAGRPVLFIGTSEVFSAYRLALLVLGAFQQYVEGVVKLRASSPAMALHERLRCGSLRLGPCCSYRQILQRRYG